MKKYLRKKLIELFELWSGETAQNVNKLPQSGSSREYIRISGDRKSAIGTYNDDFEENEAFLYYSDQFYKKGLNVPRIYYSDRDNHIYLQEDLGDTTLFSYLSKIYNDDHFPEALITQYKKVLRALPHFQVTGSKNLDFSYAYPRHSFDKQSMMWDLNYFKYYFLKLAQVSFNEEALEKDFHSFTDYLLQADRTYFLYRDFQSRNIMLKNDSVYFIDYQGGRQGALQYDLASLLYDSKANIPQAIRESLTDYYLNELEKHIPVNRKAFLEYFQGYVLIRIMQAMGAYGFRGFYEKKKHFLKSIPYALKNLDYLLDHYCLPIEIPRLRNALRNVTRSKRLQKIGKETPELTVTIKSFSYKKGIPVDTSGNGGGFTFDCRCLSNPGRYDKYKSLTGKDQAVIDFFRDSNDIETYLQYVYSLVDMSVEKYLERKFTHLMVSFGCTGGQHRSVYCAEQLQNHLQEKYSVNINLSHTEHHLFKE